MRVLQNDNVLRKIQKEQQTLVIKRAMSL